jgi:hypothetical protein
MHCTKDSADKKLKTYDFVLIGYRPKDNGFYIEKYTGVTADLFEAATNATSFKTADEFITATQNAAYVYADNNDWVKSYNGKLGKDDDGKDYGDKAVSLKQFKVTITQEEKGKYKILQVPKREMERFIDSSTKMKNDITYFQPEEVELKKGDKVRIVGGLFDGYEGTLLKAKGRAKRMFLINFELLGAIGTHIEPQYIKVISKHPLKYTL